MSYSVETNFFNNIKLMSSEVSEDVEGEI